MSHSYNKSDGTFPHKKDGGVLGKQHKPKSGALDRVKGTLFEPNKSSLHKVLMRQKEEYQAKDARKKGNDLIKAERERLKNKYK